MAGEKEKKSKDTDDDANMEDKNVDDDVRKDENARKVDKKSDDNNDKTSKNVISPTYDIATILDVIGSIKYAIAEQSISTSNFVADKMHVLNEFFQISFEFLTDVPYDYTIWEDVINEQVYIIHKPNYAIDFNDCDTFVSTRLKIRDLIIQDSKKILMKPKRKIIINELVYDPNSVGIDYEKIFQLRSKEQERKIVQLFCKGEDDDGSIFTKVRTLADPRVAKTRNNLLNYSRNCVLSILDRVKEYVKICSDVNKESLPILKTITCWQQVLPFCDPFLKCGVFDHMSRAPQLRFEYITSLFEPDLVMKQISYADLNRIANTNVTRASFANDFMQSSYKAEWGELISLYFASWLSPGDLLIEIDFDDVTSDQIIKGVIVSLFILASVSYDDRGGYCNVTYTSIQAATKKILEWLMLKNIVDITDVNGAQDGRCVTQLSRARLRNEHRRAGAFSNEDLKVLGGVDGRAGVNTKGSYPPKTTDRLKYLYPDIAYRHNIAIDEDDYDAYERQNIQYIWPLEESIKKFLLVHADLRPYNALVLAFLKRLKSFYVRLNEYRRISHYSIFTRSENANAQTTQERGNYLSISMKSMIFAFMAKSWPDDQRFQAKYDSISRMKMQSGFFSTLIDASQRYGLVSECYERMNLKKKVKDGKCVKMACQKYPHLEYIFDMLETVSAETGLKKLMMDPFIRNSAFYRLFLDIDLLSENSLLRDGVMPEFYFHYMINRINDDYIIDRLERKGYVENFQDYTAEGQNLRMMDYRFLEVAFKNHAFKWILSKANDKFFQINVFVPYEIDFGFPNTNFQIPISAINTDGVDVTIQKSLRVDKIKVFLSQLDGSKYNVKDSYVTNPLVIEAAFPSLRFKTFIIKKRSDFVSELMSRGILENAITGSNFSFVSGLEFDRTV